MTRWFEERETAAKRGRRVFTEMLRLLRSGKSRGVIVHKIDRSARNLRDWADLGDLIDQGIDAHFVSESLDLHSRGGRLSADIQAVVAADYVRNLREEILKGFYGRLKQGFYPLPAPIGYLDQGGGKPKIPDPKRAPFVREAFDLYATGSYTLETLGAELTRRGLRSRRGESVSRNGLAKLLHNSFYTGLIRIARTRETFEGCHDPIVPRSLFDRVQQVLSGNVNARRSEHDFLFRRLLRCTHCGYSLIGERQKGRYVYYRCHTKRCPTTGIREEIANTTILDAFAPLAFSARERRYLAAQVHALRANWTREREDLLAKLRFTLETTDDRLGRLTDAYLDHTIDKDLFLARKESLLTAKHAAQEQLADLEAGRASVPDRLENFLELAGSAYQSYLSASAAEKRDLVEIVTSNRTVDRKSLALTLSLPFRLVAERAAVTTGGPSRDEPRTLNALARKLWSWFQDNSDI